MRRFYSLLWLLFVSQVALGQATSFIPDVKSPNVASLGTFGEIPVSLFTGVPDVAIPIVELKGKSLSLPIVLRYHPGNIKPNQRSGWVGTGWNISMGTIYREVRGKPDERNSDRFPQNGYYFRRALDFNNWHLFAEAPQLSGTDLLGFHLGLKYYVDLEPDIFHFNVMGLQGSFFLDHKGKWQVQSDQYATVELDPDVPFIDPLTKSSFNSDLVSKSFNKFIITDGFGNKYVFGGADAIEYTSIIDWGKIRLGTVMTDAGGLTLQASSWSIIEVRSADQVDKIEFKYERGPFVSNLYKYAIGNRIHRIGCSSYLIPQYWSVGGSLVFPVYPKEVTLNNQKLILSMSKSDELNYERSDYVRITDQDDRYISLMGDLIYNARQHVPYYKPNQPIDYYQNIIWMKLDSIKLLVDNKNLKTVNFEYNNIPSERLFLNTLTHVGENSRHSFNYSFTYNQKEQMPKYLNNLTDHWGFDNGKLYGDSVSETNIYSKKEPDVAYLTKGILKEIKYPTGGKTVFDFQIGTFSKFVKKNDRKSFQTEAGAGGIRIWKVRTFDENNKATSEREYLYSKSAVNNGLESSGILNNKPLYFILSTPAIDNYGASFSFESFKSNSLINLNDQGGTLISYTEVTEVTHVGDGKQYKTEFFTNHDNGYTDDNRFYNFYSNDLIINPVSSRNFERGRSLRTVYFNNEKNRVKSTGNKWKIGDPSVSSSRALLFNYLETCNEEYYYPSSSAYLNYYHAVTLQSTTDTLFTSAGHVIDSVVFDYDPYYKTLKSKVSKSSNGDITKSYYRYPLDLVDVQITEPPVENCLQYLVKKKMLSEPVELVNTVKKDGLEYVTSASTKFYQPINLVLNGVNKSTVKLQRENQIELYKPLLLSNYQSLTFQGMSAGSEVFVEDANMKLKHTYLYDNLGLPNEYFFRNSPSPDSYIWDKNGLYLLSKVKGAQRSDIAYSSFEQGEEKGSWIYADSVTSGSGIQPGIVASANATSGKNVFFCSATNNSIGKTGLNPSLRYVLSFHSSTAIPLLNGILKVNEAVPNSSMTYYEYEVTGINNLTIAGSQGTYIDELRLYPKGAQMTTYTYKPLVGMTSQTDTKGHTTLYEYDALSRLSQIRDAKKDIITNYAYHYQKPLVFDKQSNWQDLGERRCVTLHGGNTGEQQRQLTDINYYSASYKQTKWESMGITGNCTLPVIYARLEYGNSSGSYYYYYTQRRVVFYSDENGTMPMMINRPVTVNYGIDTWYNGYSHGYAQSITLPAGTSSYYLGTEHWNDDHTDMLTYYLNEGDYNLLY